MFTQEDVNIIALELPAGAIAEISRETTISRPTVYRFFNGKKIRNASQSRIYLAALKIIKRDREATRKIIQERTRILGEPATT